MKKFVNFLTIIRLISTFILPFIWNAINPNILIILVTVILLTDFFDGFFARMFNVQTIFGSCLDTIADKTFGIVLVLILAKSYKLLYLVFLLELFIAIVNVVGSLLGATTKSSFIGKIKMWVMGIALFLVMINIFSVEINEVINVTFIDKTVTSYIVDLMCSLTAGSQLIVAVDYLKQISKEIQDNHKNPKYKKITYKFKNKDKIIYALFSTEFYKNNKNQPLSKIFLS